MKTEIDEATTRHILEVLERFCREDVLVLVNPREQEELDGVCVRDEKGSQKGLPLFDEEDRICAGFTVRVTDDHSKLLLVSDHAGGFSTEVGLAYFPGAVRTRSPHLHILDQRLRAACEHALLSSLQAIRGEKLSQLPLAGITATPGKPMSVRMEFERALDLKRRKRQRSA